ncbi:DUF4239 domain-containing protein [Streptomyces sp. NHF165]|nr:DUF4239 domain-containing protein [Streptomyces sp. NHF165]
MEAGAGGPDPARRPGGARLVVGGGHPAGALQPLPQQAGVGRPGALPVPRLGRALGTPARRPAAAPGIAARRTVIHHGLWRHWLLFAGSAAALVAVRLARLPAVAACLLLVGAAVLLVNSALPLARHGVRRVVADQNSTVQTAVFAIVGSLYATLVHFSVVVVWNGWSQADTTVVQEANALADLERMSHGFSGPVHRQVRETSLTYTAVVINDEWPAMARRDSAPQAHAALSELWTIYTSMGPDDRGNALYGPSIERLGQLDDNRRLRLRASARAVPTVVWVMFHCGGALAVVMVFFFGVRRDWLQRLIVSVLAGVVALSVFLVTSFERPFAGEAGVRPDAFTAVQAQLREGDR